MYIGDPFPMFDKHGEEMITERDDSENLIKVVLSEHHGRRTDTPFKIKTTQLV